MRKRAKHNLSNLHISTFDIGKLYPINCIEALPGDTIQGDASALIRLSPLVKPIMQPIEVRIHHFFVPFRLLWSGWEDFITNEGGTLPTISGGGHVADTVYGYLGIVNDASNNFMALPIRAYNMIYNQYYRDQDLITEVSEDSVSIQNIAWAKDYFTSARAWAQKGTAVTIPIGSTAPVQSTGDTIRLSSADYTNVDLQAESTYQRLQAETTLVSTDKDVFFGNQTGLEADLSSATSISAIDFREAFALQRYQEARARYGSNYVDYLRYLGVNPRDGRLDRVEYMAGGKTQLNISEVLNTSATTGEVGDLYGHGISAMRSNRYRRFIEEHGYVMSMLSMRPLTFYGNGLPRKFSRTSMEDFYQKELENIGAQEILNKELYTAHTTPGGVFGYQDRYREYREENNIITGQMRAAALDEWHMGRLFSSDPSLNQSFIEVDGTTVNRPFADTGTYDNTRAMIKNNVVARRMVSRIAKTSLL